MLTAQVGSFADSKGVVKPMLNVDIAIRIPDSALLATDSLNYRYFDKRALFLKLVRRWAGIYLGGV